MKNSKLLFYSFLFISASAFGLRPSALVFADEPLDSITGLGKGYQTEQAIADPLTAAEKLLSNVTGFLTVAGGVTFLIYIILAGLSWITAGEQSEKISKAKQMFTNAIVGLAILVIAWAFTGVMETIFGFNILSPKQTLLEFIKFD